MIGCSDLSKFSTHWALIRQLKQGCSKRSPAAGVNIRRIKEVGIKEKPSFLTKNKDFSMGDTGLEPVTSCV